MLNIVKVFIIIQQEIFRILNKKKFGSKKPCIKKIKIYVCPFYGGYYMWT